MREDQKTSFARIAGSAPPPASYRYRGRILFAYVRCAKSKGDPMVQNGVFLYESGENGCIYGLSGTTLQLVIAMQLLH